MSVTVSKTDGATVFTVVSDPHCHWPPLCQILKGLCYSPAWCSVPQHLRRVRRVSLLVLGMCQTGISTLTMSAAVHVAATLQIMIGLFSFCLAIIVHNTKCGFGCWTVVEVIGFPYWSATLFVLFGAMCILSDINPCRCLVIPNLVLNMVGIIVAAGAIVLHSVHLPLLYDAAIDGLLIVLSVLEFCVTISSFVLECKVLKSIRKEENRNTESHMDMQNLESSTETVQTTYAESTEHSYETRITSESREEKDDVPDEYASVDV